MLTFKNPFKLFLVFIASLAILSIGSYVLAEETITITVKNSVCGNEIKEGGEDCDGSDLDGQSCETIGFGPGNLTCHSSCAFITADCSPAPTSTPTPSPTATPSPEPSVSETPASNPEENPSSDEETNPAIIEESFIESIISQIAEIVNNYSVSEISLPAKLKAFDITGTGRLNVKELKMALQEFVKNLRVYREVAIYGQQVESEKEVVENCDINGDDKCDLVDFSVILYYAE